MRIFNKISYTSPSPAVVALGCFDGVHLGHISVLKKAVEIANELDIPCVVFTFDKPPKNFFSQDTIPLITSPSQKARLISELGADVLLSVPFSEEIATLSHSDFADSILIKNLCAAHVVCGFNYTFGAKAKGNPEFLSKFCDDKDIGFTVLPELEIDGECISSSKIRELIKEGHVERASAFLGRNYSISEKVVGDKGLARELGFATANQFLNKETLLPRCGVYATRAKINSVSYHAITNVGTRPTVNGSALCAETHILDFCGDIYGQELEVEFLKFIRPEKRFDSIDELQAQVLKDIEALQSINNTDRLNDPRVY